MISSLGFAILISTEKTWSCTDGDLRSSGDRFKSQELSGIDSMQYS